MSTCCKFVLKNLSKKPVKVHVGFPLDREVHGTGPAPDATDMVMSYHFIARDADNTYHVQYVTGDKSKYNELFLWDMTFASEETKVLQVGYIIPMSYTAAVTLRGKIDLPLRPEKPWHAMLEGCIVEHFSYITETGSSWAGPIEKATFRVEAGSFEWFLDRRPTENAIEMALFAAQFAAQPKAKPDPELMKKMMGGPPETSLSVAAYRDVSPDGWKQDSEHGAITWEFRNFRPGPPLRLRYYSVLFPRDTKSCDEWVRLVLGAKPAKADLLELREITAAFYGIAPQSESAKKFAVQQIWYHPKSGLRESELSDNQQAVLKSLDSIAKNAK